MFAESESQIGVLSFKSLAFSVRSLEFSSQNLVAPHGSCPRQSLDAGWKARHATGMIPVHCFSSNLDKTDSQRGMEGSNVLLTGDRLAGFVKVAESLIR